MEFCIDKRWISKEGSLGFEDLWVVVVIGEYWGRVDTTW